MKHISVLNKETVELLNVQQDGVYVDLTLGRAGHSKEILKKLRNGHLYAFDLDLEAIKESDIVLKSVGNNYTLIHDNFRFVDEQLKNYSVKQIDGAVIDLGVSSPQFDDEDRGFSYRFDSELDMRMNKDSSISAKLIVNTYSVEALFKIFDEYGEDKYSYKIAKEIARRREEKPIETTFDLVDIIKSVKPMSELNKKGHPAKQIFQALRIEVNDELNNARIVLEKLFDLLNIGGRICVITFHSLEDRIVKTLFKQKSTVEGTRYNVYSIPTEDDKPNFKLVNRKPIIASQEELEINNRARSAKLRVIERIK